MDILEEMVETKDWILWIGKDGRCSKAQCEDVWSGP